MYHILCKLGNGETHGGHHGGHWTPLVMPTVMLDAPCHDGGITYYCKTPLNIDIYPSTLFFFFENIGNKYDFELGWGGPWYWVGWVGMSSSKKTNLFHQINSYLLTINIYNNFPIK